MDEQRKRVYGYRQKILEGTPCKQLILEMIDQQIEHYLGTFLDRDYGPESFAKWAGGLLTVELDPRDFRGLDFATAESLAKEQAERAAETQIFEAIEENLPAEEEESEWNWESLAKFANVRWKTNYRDRDLKKIGRDQLAEELIASACEAIRKIDLSEGARFLEEDFGVRTACGWVHYKFGIELDPREMRAVEPAAFKQLVRERATEAYEHKETEYPVIAGLYHFTTRDAGGQKRYDRDALVAWARQRFQVELNLDDLKSKQRDEIRALLVEHSRTNQQRANEALAEVRRRVEQLFDGQPDDRPMAAAADGNGALDSLTEWLRDSFDAELDSAELARLDRQQLQRRLELAVEDHFRPEMRRMERALLLQILDTAWKDHLLAMDHLRSSVGLRGYAQVDPKVEYKREGMRTFEQMWNSVGERVTDLIFRMEQLDEDFVGSTWQGATALHDEAPPATQIAAQQQSAIDASQQTDRKIEPIRNLEQRVGRNEPCPCGSGKKYKNCCLRKGGLAGV
jgi:preprotein translocase subunit SecA